MVHQSVGPTVPKSMKVLIDHRARVSGDASYLLVARSDRVVTYADLANQVDNWGGVLREWGVQSGDRLGLMLDDPVDYTLAFLGLLSHGVWVAPLDPSLLKLSGAHLNERLARLALRGVVSKGAPPEGAAAQWFDVSRVVNAIREVASTSETSEEGGVILASSGTTGTPKVVALSNRQLLHTARLIAEHNELNEADQSFNPLPLWHINAEVVAVLAILMAGASLALDDRFHRTNFLVDGGRDRRHMDQCGAGDHRAPGGAARRSGVGGARRARGRERGIRSSVVTRRDCRR
jgi:acyl-CoA synthetase (AMP-forming)/AMP-acid ligase II